MNAIEETLARLTELFLKAKKQIADGERSMLEASALETALRDFVNRSVRQIAPESFPMLEMGVLRDILQDLNAKGRNALMQRYPRLTLADLIRLNPLRELEFAGFGSSSLEQLKQALERRNLFFGMDEDELRRRVLLLRRK